MSEILLPESRSIVFDEEAVKSNDGDTRAAYFKNLIADLESMYQELAQAHNRGPDYASQVSEPTPAEGQFLVWRDENNNLRLLYNDQGTVQEFVGVAPVGVIVGSDVEITVGTKGLILKDNATGHRYRITILEGPDGHGRLVNTKL